MGGVDPLQFYMIRFFKRSIGGRELLSDLSKRDSDALMPALISAWLQRLNQDSAKSVDYSSWPAFFRIR
jgi:hypothetical protein